MSQHYSPAKINPEHAKTQFANDLKVIAAAEAQGCVSIDSIDDLPEALRYLEKMLPGLLFQHHPPEGEVIPQFRPDNPKAGPKYIFPKGSGSVLSINPTMTIDRPTVAIVEGTKQAIFAAAYAPDDVLVVGIQGCQGWSSDGQALAALDALVDGKDVIVIFDADVATNPNVYAAGASLVETLEVIHATSIKFASIPGSKSVGLDDFLTRRPEAKRGEVFVEILAKATPFTKIKKPAKRRVSVDAKGATFNYVSTLLGEMCAVEFEKVSDDGTIAREQEGHPVAGEIDTETGKRVVRRVETLLNAAVTVESMITNVDDLTVGAEPTVSRDLLVQIGPADDCQTYVIKDVPDSKLGDVRTWLARAGEAGANVELGPNGIGVAGGQRIAEAIRADTKSRAFNRRVVRPHTGWYEYEGEHMWTDSTGSHTATGKRTDVVAKLEGGLASLEIPGYFENFELRDVYAAIDALFDVENYLYDATAFVATVSAFFWALAGGDPDAVLYIHGSEGSGKTSIIGLVTNLLSPQWGTELNPMASADGTSAYLRDLPKQLHNVLLVVDDVRARTSARSQDAQADGLEYLIRTGYAGGGAGSSKKALNANREWAPEKPKLNRVFVCLAGEVLPEKERQSSIERNLVVEVVRGTVLKPAGATPSGESGPEHFARLCIERTLVPIVSRFLVSMAERIEKVGGLEKRKNKLSRRRAIVTNEVVVTRVVSASARVPKVAGTFVSGVRLLLKWVEEIGYFDPVQYQKVMGVKPNYQRSRQVIEDFWIDLLIAATQRHSIVNLYSNGEGESVISSVSGKKASGDYRIDEGPDDSFGGTVILTKAVGRFITETIDGEEVECVALIQEVVEKDILQRKHLSSVLDNLLVKTEKGEPTWSVRIRGTTTRCFMIRRSLWEANGRAT
ncbi:MAG: hypothetical protein HKL85_13450 [Acidimicrobiaceae bacterium]|nr:hypothetical protein [Acidimicrobiaceae bacterium]